MPWLQRPQLGEAYRPPGWPTPYRRKPPGTGSDRRPCGCHWDVLVFGHERDADHD